MIENIKSKLTPKQIEVLTDYHKINPIYTILEGAKRSGKTRILTLIFLEHLFKFRNQNKIFLLSGATQGAVEKNIIMEINQIFNLDLRINSKNFVELFGNKIYCFGGKDCDDYKAIKGLTSFGWYGNEITEQHPITVKECIDRCSGKGFKIFWDTNPSHPTHFIKTDFIDKSGHILPSGRVLIKSYNFRLTDNTFLPQDYIEGQLTTKTSKAEYERDIEGKWVIAEGVCYDCFDTYKNRVSQLPPKENIVKYIAGIDWGFEHRGALVVLCQDNLGNYYIIDEIAENKKFIEWWVEKARYFQKKYPNIIFYGDTENKENIEKFRANGINIYGANKNAKSVVNGISYINSLFANKRLFYLEGYTPNFLKEIFLYRWKDNSLKEEPVKENDDIMDALRYPIYSEQYSKEPILYNRQFSVNF